MGSQDVRSDILGQFAQLAGADVDISLTPIVDQLGVNLHSSVVVNHLSALSALLNTIQMSILLFIIYDDYSKRQRTKSSELHKLFTIPIIRLETTKKHQQSESHNFRRKT